MAKRKTPIYTKISDVYDENYNDEIEQKIFQKLMELDNTYNQYEKQGLLTQDIADKFDREREIITKNRRLAELRFRHPYLTNEIIEEYKRIYPEIGLQERFNPDNFDVKKQTNWLQALTSDLDSKYGDDSILRKYGIKPGNSPLLNTPEYKQQQKEDRRISKEYERAMQKENYGMKKPPQRIGFSNAVSKIGKLGSRIVPGLGQILNVYDFLKNPTIVQAPTRNPIPKPKPTSQQKPVFNPTKVFQDDLFEAYLKTKKKK